MIVFQTFNIQCDQTFQPSNYPNDVSDRIINTELWLERILLKFQYTEEGVTCVRENSWNLWKHFDMSVRTKCYLRLGAYVATIWNGTQIG